MKKLFFLFLSLFVVSFAFAQEAEEDVDDVKKTPAERAEARTQKMIKHLELTADQQPKVKDATLDFVTKLDALKADKALKANKGQFSVKRKALVAEYETKLKDILTPAQLEKYKTKKAEIVAKKKEDKAQNVKGKGMGEKGKGNANQVEKAKGKKE